jgi:plasmid maintenance system antidote protein VapI
MKMSYELKIDPKKRAGSRFIGKVRKALISAAVDEKTASGINQQQLATALGVNRSVITRMLKGEGNLTLRSVGEIAWALGWEPNFTLQRKSAPISNQAVVVERPTSSSTVANVTVYSHGKTPQSIPHVEAAE